MCLLTVQEQHSGTAVREFWVDREKHTSSATGAGNEGTG